MKSYLNRKKGEIKMSTNEVVTLNDKKYYGYQSMLFMFRPRTLSRKKPVMSVFTKDKLQVDVYDFYHSFYFFAKLGNFPMLINIYKDDMVKPLLKNTPLEEIKQYYQDKFDTIDQSRIDDMLLDIATNEQKQAGYHPEFVRFCQDYDFFVLQQVKNEKSKETNPTESIDSEKPEEVVHIAKPCKKSIKTKKKSKKKTKKLS